MMSGADAVAVIVGIVLGAGIFKAPALVAANTGGDGMLLLLWLAGGVIALLGALCYGELAAAWPSTGGEYHFLRRAWGTRTAFLFGWARLAVLQPGSIALLAFVYGDYMTELLPLGPWSPAIHATLAVLVFTAINMAGMRAVSGVQRWFTGAEALAVLGVALLGLVAAAMGAGVTTTPDPSPPAGSGIAGVGLAMVFVLLTYGGWNEAAYVSAEVRGRRAILQALIVSLGIVTVLYLLINLACLRVLGRAGMAASPALAADLMRVTLGDAAAGIVALVVALCALTSLSATIVTGARSNHAMGIDYERVGFLGHWDGRVQSPRNALLLQAAIVVVLVAFGAVTRSGFVTMVEYTAPVFWFFLLLTGLALIRLRHLEPRTPRPFRVPLYPLVPIVFCLSSAFLLWSSLRYTGTGALVGMLVLLSGLPVLWFLLRRQPIHPNGELTHEASQADCP